MNKTTETGTGTGVSGPFFRQLRIHCGVKRPAFIDYVAIHARDYGTGIVTTTRGLASLEEKPVMPLIYVRVLEDMIGRTTVREIIAEMKTTQATNR